jgi:aspartate/methionine/tyrosine aminotransferase
LLDVKDHLIVVRPNYSTNIEVPKTIGCEMSFVDLAFEDEWRVNMGAIEKAIRADTKLISITSPHNPTGMLMREDELNELVALAEQKNIHLLVDETYRDACFKTPYPIVASKSKKVISVSSLSKAFGLPGLRIGWLITQDENLMEQFLAAKEMIYISNSAIDEEIGYQFLRQKERFEASINERSMRNFNQLKNWLKKESRLECILPKGGVVCFPRFANPNSINLEIFYNVLKEKYKTMVGPGHWFAMPDSYFRLGFGWVDEVAFKQGLVNLGSAIDESAK